METAQISEFNEIEMTIFDLSKEIMVRAVKANQYQKKMWMLKIRSIIETIESFCKEINVDFIFGLFEKLVHCLMTLFVSNNET